MTAPAVPRRSGALRRSGQAPGDAEGRDVEGRDREGTDPGGHAVRVTVTLPPDLAAEVRERAGDRGVSRFVVEALRRRIQQENLRFLVADLAEASGGPFTPEELADADSLWPDENNR